MKTRIIIDPACDFYYSSFYIIGLKKIYGRSVKFSSKYFKRLHYEKTTHIFAFVVENNKELKRIVIDFADAPDINENFITWCDIYGKVNYLRSATVGREKIVPIAPNYAVKIWSKPIAGIIALLNYIKSYNRSIAFYLYLSKYLMTSRRQMNLSCRAITKKPGYIFFISTLWYGQDQTNRQRADFIRACRSIPDIEFEGGMVPDQLDKQYPEYGDVIIKDTVSYDEYILKTCKSLIVFNTPAYHLCHGWKLAEFLALGKAIISTSLVNDLPTQLEHMKNIYFVPDNMNGIVEGIKFLIDNQQVREALEKGAIEYYDSYINPVKSMLSVV